MLIAIITIFGLVIGSFLSVCIYRIPLTRLERYDEHGEPLPPPETDPAQPAITVANPPRSFCPQCRARLHWWHNIPLLSWLLLRGRCAFCRAAIPVRYPMVEALSALFAVLSYLQYGLTPTGVLVYLFAATLLVVSFIDYDYYIIPNVISLPGFALGLLTALINHATGIFETPVAPTIWMSLLGVLAGAGFLLLVSEVYLRARKKEGLGMGDVKLLAMTGAFFGPYAALYTIFIGSLLGSILGLLLIAFLGRKMSHQLPFGPYLAIATLLFLFGGRDLLSTLAEAIAGLTQ